MPFAQATELPAYMQLPFTPDNFFFLCLALLMALARSLGFYRVVQYIKKICNKINA